MNIRKIRRFLGICTLLNYAVLIVWFAVFTLSYDWLYGVHSSWFPMSKENYDVANYLAMAVYKILVLVLNLIPYIALSIIGSGEDEENS
ncbi:MAG TPA: hypothetical protein PLR83_05370 [Pyrinomonadaceae bacterium]|nr:hypothetical protein [Pyrinomonadaceae bacterium]